MADILSLDALVHEPARVAELPRGAARTMIAQLAALTLALTTQLAEDGERVTAGRPPTAERYLTIREAAERLRCTPDHLYRHVREYPFIKRVGRRTLRVCPEALARWVAARSR